jgi:hypothetical protein
MQDVEEGKVVTLEQALTGKPPVSDELQKIFDIIEKMDAEKEAWKKMFDLQTKIVTHAELDKMKLEKEVDGLKKEVKMYKDIVRLADHLQQERAKRTKYI